MKRTTSTAKTRGMVTRIITITNAVLRVYDTETDSADVMEFELIGAIPERQVVTKCYQQGKIDRKRHKVLKIIEVSQVGRLYAMPLDAYMARATIIEDGIVD